ncbi:MAG: hypothetical protein DWB48_02905 [Nitrosomonas sp.]|nr:hypothetical protein [Nitrosomonas sp.]
MRDSYRGSHSELADLKQGLAGNIESQGWLGRKQAEAGRKCWPGRKPEDAFLAGEKIFIGNLKLSANQPAETKNAYLYANPIFSENSR